MKLEKVLNQLSPDANVIICDSYGNTLSEMYRNIILQNLMANDKDSNILKCGVTKILPHTYHAQFFPTIEYFEVCLNIQKGE